LLLTLLLRPKNVLVLDEPTSHLDIASQTVLLEALQQFPGTVFFVSHDRLFIDGLAEKVIELDHGNAVVYNGDYGYFLWKKEEERNVSVETAPVNKRAVAESVSNGRRDHEKSKALRNALKKIDREETDLLERLDKLQDQLGRLEASLAQEEVYRDGERTRRITQEITENRQEEKLLYAHWQELEAERKRLETAGMDADVSEGRRGAGSG
jgi:ATP-binding cassette subfamily F protein 3